MTIGNSWKKIIAGTLAVLVVAGTVPANTDFGGLFGGTSITASAEQQETLLTTLTFGGSSTYSETTSGVVSVTATNVTDYDATFGWLWYREGSLSVTAKEGYTITKCVFIQNNKTPITDTEAPFYIHTESYGITEDTNYDMDGVTSIEVYGYATPTQTDVTGVTLNKTETTIEVGKDETLTATVSPDDATDKTVTWSSDNEEVATVDENGNVTAVKAGTATITATATNGTDDTTDDDVSAVLTVTVNKADSTVTTAPTANELTYTGKGQDLVTKGETEDGTIVYALGESADTAPNDDAFFENIPGGTEAGDYYVWYKVLGDENHNDSEPVCVKVTIAELEDSSETDSSTAESSEAESTADDSSAADSKSDTSKAADSSSKAAAAATTSNPATGAAAAGVGALALAAAALIVAKKKKDE